jgi:hypothetical protein
MTDLERALAAGGKLVDDEPKSDYERAIAMGGKPLEDDETPEEAKLRESFLNKDKFHPSPQHRKFRQEAPITNPHAEVEAMSPEGAGIRGAAGALNSAADRYTFGLYGAALRAAGNLDRIVGGSPGIAEQTLEGIDEYRRNHPVASSITDSPAYLVNGPAQLVARAADRAVVRGISAIPTGEQAIGTLAGRVFRTGATSALTSGAIAGAEAAHHGEAPRDIARRAGEAAAIGGVAGGTLGAGASLLGQLGRAVLNSEGGQARRFIEQHGGKVGLGGVDLPEGYVTKGTSDADIGAQAEASAKRGLDMLNEEKRGALRGAGNTISRVSNTPEAGAMRDVSDVVANMRAAADDIGTAPQTRAALRDLVQSIESHQPKGFNPETDPYKLSERDINQLKKSLDRAARTGASVDEKLNPLLKAANQTREMVNEGPYADANAEYAKEAKRYQESRKLLGINKNPKTPEESEASATKVKNLITRRGQNTVTAGGQEGRLAEFEARHPDIAEEFAKPEVLRKRADISFHLLPRHGGLLDRMTGGHRGVAAAIGLGTGGLTGAVPALTLTNLPALQARLLYNPALAAQEAEPMFLSEIPLLEAARRAHSEER